MTCVARTLSVVVGEFLTADTAKLRYRDDVIDLGGDVGAAVIAKVRTARDSPRLPQVLNYLSSVCSVTGGRRYTNCGRIIQLAALARESQSGFDA